MERTLPQRMTRTAGLFQALVALPTMLTMGSYIFWQLFDGYWGYNRIYDFIMFTFNAFLSAFILFIIIIQRQDAFLSLSPSYKLIFEGFKSGFATAVWLWLLLDACFGPDRRYYYNPPKPLDRTPAIIRASISVVVLLFLFYPTLVFAALERRNEKFREGDDEERVRPGEGEGERAPLLR